MEQGRPFGVPESLRMDFDAVCQKVRAAVEPARAHAVSLHDEKGEVLWLSESSMGPDEHNAVREALDKFSNIHGPAVLAYDLGDARSAVLLRAVNPRRTMAGVVMVIMDTRVIKQDDKGAVILMTPKLQRVLADFAGMRFDRAQVPGIDRLHEELRRSPIALHVQRLVPLIKEGQPHCYEVLLRSKLAGARSAAPQAMLRAAEKHGVGSMIDRRVVTELIGWLVHHPDAWQPQAAMFSVNLTATALHDEHFIKFVGSCLAKASLPKALLAFEIDVPAAVKMGGKILDIAHALHRLGCPMVLDDFGLRTECFDLLRLPAVRYIKLAPEITAKMRSDKISQAAIAAVVQMTRVLGMHTVAKHTETKAEQTWLTALGVDFIQSNSFSPSVPLATLSKVPQPKG